MCVSTQALSHKQKTDDTVTSCSISIEQTIKKTRCVSTPTQLHEPPTTKRQRNFDCKNKFANHNKSTKRGNTTKTAVQPNPLNTGEPHAHTTRRKQQQIKPACAHGWTQKHHPPNHNATSHDTAMFSSFWPHNSKNYFLHISMEFHANLNNFICFTGS